MASKALLVFTLLLAAAFLVNCAQQPQPNTQPPNPNPGAGGGGAGGGSGGGSGDAGPAAGYGGGYTPWGPNGGWWWGAPNCYYGCCQCGYNGGCRRCCTYYEPYQN